MIQENEGYWILGVGEASGPLIGGNLCTFNLLHGTDHMPDIRGSILFIEDDFLSVPETFDRDLTSLTQQPGFEEVSGLLIGRFQRAVNMSRAKLTAILAANERLARLPTIANVDFGHTDPLATIPLGEIALIDSREHGATITIRPS